MNSNQAKLPWERQRDILNHDWLQNKYLNYVGGFVSRLKKPEAHKSDIAVFIDDEFDQWAGWYSKATWVVDNFEKEMTPAVLLSREGPLSLLPESEKAWMTIVLDILWRERNPVNQWIAEARNTLSKVNAQYEVLSIKVREVGDNEWSSLGALRKEFDEYSQACAKFSESLSRFPHRILI